jgi:hypothetical protein
LSAVTDRRYRLGELGLCSSRPVETLFVKCPETAILADGKCGDKFRPRNDSEDGH